MTPELFHPGKTPRKCRRHQWSNALLRTEHIRERFPHDCYFLKCGGMLAIRCFTCGIARGDVQERARRGRLNRSRGNAIERSVAKELGLRRVGQFGGPEDVGTHADPFIVQVKSGKSFPERLYRWLRALPSNANQTPLLVITDAPGPGHRRRALVVLTLEDWVSLHGSTGTEEAA